MGLNCILSNCKNSAKNAKSKNKKISFFRFPKVKKHSRKECQDLQRSQREAWFRAVAVSRKNLSTLSLDEARICSEHFVNGKPANYRDITNPAWEPLLKLHKLGSKDSDAAVQLQAKRCNRQTERYNHRAKREQQKSIHMDHIVVNTECERTSIVDTRIYDEESIVNIIIEPTINVDEEVLDGVRDVGVQSDLTSSLVQAMENELQRRMEEILTLRETVNRILFKEESFQNDDKKVKFYTGLPSFASLTLILSQTTSALDSVKIKKLSNFQKLILTLMKLRNNASFRSLAYQFNIRSDEASYCFKNVIIILELAFRSSVQWPDRECLQTVVPLSCREAFGNSIAVITECFEVRSERASNAKTRAQCFSDHKNTDTTKYLIGITPSGAISFISDGFGGQTSDEFISENSGLLDLLLPGDIVLANKGFIIKEAVSMQYAELLTPNFTKSQEQLPPEVIQKTKKIASMRTHVKPVIGFVRNKFRILKGPIQVNLMNSKQGDKCLLDYIVRVCCILNNMCESVLNSNVGTLVK